MNKTVSILTATLIATGCATVPADNVRIAGDTHPRCEAAFEHLRLEGPSLVRDLQSCLDGGLDRRDLLCLDTRRFAAFSANSKMTRICVDNGWLRPPLNEAATTAANLKAISRLAGKLGNRAKAMGL